ncbi:MAG TPA: c-type cytochrome, partial [Cellvibrionaceae bacterium]|nr:c-type cytochrome [Cellvibrionaceae bacterium]
GVSHGIVFLALYAIDAAAAGSSTQKTTSSQEETWQADSRAGKILAEENRCAECHGLDGNGQSNTAGSLGVFPKLAGQNAAYLWKQIKDFRSDQRHSDIMSIMARSVDDADARNILGYYSSLPKMQGKAAASNPAAESLFKRGDDKRGLAACARCHGEGGKGLAAQPLVPIIGGQDRAYLHKQLSDWRSGERKNSPDGAMSAAAKLLTDQEINSLADYLSAL